MPKYFSLINLSISNIICPEGRSLLSPGSPANLSSRYNSDSKSQPLEQLIEPESNMRQGAGWEARSLASGILDLTQSGYDCGKNLLIHWVWDGPGNDGVVLNNPPKKMVGTVRCLGSNLSSSEARSCRSTRCYYIQAHISQEHHS